MNKHVLAVGAIVALVLAAAPDAQAQVPPDIAKQMRDAGPIDDAMGTAKMYRPLQPGRDINITTTRDVSYGPHPRLLLDVATSVNAGAPTRPVLIFVAGGGGNRAMRGPDGEPFFDNMLQWAVKNGMTAVSIQRATGADRSWEDQARDIGLAVAWAKRSAARYGADANRIFIWAHSNAMEPVGAYIAHPQFHPPDGVGLTGAVMLSGTMNILPIRLNVPEDAGRPVNAARVGQPPAGPPAAGRGQAPPVDPETLLKRSTLPGLRTTPVALFFGAGEIDTPGPTAFIPAIREELCKTKCPTTMVFKDYNHMATIFAPNTADNSMTGPILKWMRSAPDSTQ